MIKDIILKGFGPIADVECRNLQNINVLIGHNGAGKTFMLKSLYAALKTVEQYKRGKEPRTQKELLSDALYWTFQVNSLGALVRKGFSSLDFSMRSDKDEWFSYTFGVSTTKSVQSVTDSFSPTDVNNVFIPAKEIVSIQDVILRSFEVDKVFGFDKSYVDLSRALSKTVQGRNYREFSEARKSLGDAVGGRIEYDDDKKNWMFRDKERRVFEINITSEGIKRLAILDLLLGNHYLTRQSIIIIDEAEANLHPDMISRFMEILVSLAKAGLQIFISTHSYFVIKNLYVLANRNNMHIPVISFAAGHAKQNDLLDGMPENPIIRESVNLYRKEIEL
ncbi:MAG: ATP-binding protein [Bacteroidales bacterium]|nr:ATP-binding protein [Bacteroidales bacterium]MCM1147022.1 ATP-binding protein [Bacteroidales bacterium]MCM1205845.1 ATP-binding protein [Bacillota bacterium]MCM1509914.1 ATP-binding protein [Clostridium sp.]